MKNRKFIYLKNSFIWIAFVTGISCEREISDEVEFNFQNSPVFYRWLYWRIKLLPVEGSYFQAFTVDQETKYKGFSYAI
jgi:hypothetical protein